MSQQKKPGFQSSHFHDAGDYLAHTRVNDRMVPVDSIAATMPELAARIKDEGKTEAKVLFVEEVQSDRAQKGRAEGFAGPRVTDTTGWTGTIVGTGEAAFYRVKDAAGEWIANIPADSPEAAIAEAARRLGTKPGIAPAPFVTKTDSWTALVLKRILRMAAEGGYDAVSWTTGEQQVTRYNDALRKTVDVIEWKKTAEGVHLVGFKYKGTPVGRAVEDGAGGIVQPTMRARITEIRNDANDAIERNDYLGFDTVSLARQAIIENASDWHLRWPDIDAADRRTIQAYVDQQTGVEPVRDKVVDTTEKESVLSDAIGKAMADKIRNDPNQEGTIEGEGITVSDTGMSGYYNRIVPKVVREVLKPLGGGKVEEISIVTKDQRTNMTIASDGTNYWVKDSRTQARLSENAPDYMAAAKLEEALRAGETKQMAVEITPEMRKKILAGQTLFQDRAQERDDTHLGSYNVAERLITTFAGANKSTVIHELGHHFLEDLKYYASRPGATAKIRADWDTARREFAIGEDGDISTASHEMMARTWERYLAEGEAPSEGLRGVFEQFKRWMLEIYQDIRTLGVPINPEIRKLFDNMLATQEEGARAADLDIPRAYVPEANAAAVERIVTPAGASPRPEVPPASGRTPEPPAPPEGRRIEPGFAAEKIAIQPYADELPPGPGEAPDTSHVNYAYINTPMDVKLTMQRMAEIDQANIQRQRGGTEGVKSWAAANAEQARYVNDILGGDADTLKVLSPRDPDAPGPDVKLGILKKLAVGAAKDSARLRDVVLLRGADATVREQLEYMGSIERARMIQAEFLGERAGVARALNALKDANEGSGEIGRMLDAIGYGEAAARELYQAARTPAEEAAILKAKLDEILQNYRGKTVLDIAKLHKEIGTLKGTFKFAEEASKATKWEMVIEGWKSGLLSGPVTHTTNLFGTGAFQLMRAPVDALAVVVGMARGASPGMGETDRASMSEAIARITGMLGGVEDGLKVGYHTFMLDETTGKTESYRNAIPGLAGDIIRIPLRAMAAEDAIVTTMYKRGELKTLAIRTAFDENLNPATREFAERVDFLMDHPTPELEVKADAAATRMSFNMPLGEKGVALQGFVNKWKLQPIIPFIRTPINIFKEVFRMSPFAPVIGEWRAAIAKGGVERDRAIAEWVLGSGIAALTMSYAFSGAISGAGSPDPGKQRGKAGVWQPYSILIGDRWYEYSRIQPTGTLIGMAADIANVWEHMTDEEKDKVPKMISVAFANAVTNQTFLQGIANFVNVMSDPDRYGPQFVNQFAASLVPNIVGQPTTMADPLVREVNNSLEAIQARIPGMREQLLPKRDWLGEPVPTKERMGGVMPVREQPVSEDKVRLEAARLDISMAQAPKKTHIGKGTGKMGEVEFTPEERNAFAKAGGEFAHGILASIVTAPGYDAMPDLIKRKIFAKVLAASHQVAAVAAMPMEKRIAYLQEITENIQAELQPESTP